ATLVLRVHQRDGLYGALGPQRRQIDRTEGPAVADEVQLGAALRTPRVRHEGDEQNGRPAAGWHVLVYPRPAARATSGGARSPRSSPTQGCLMLDTHS